MPFSPLLHPERRTVERRDKWGRTITASSLVRADLTSPDRIRQQMAFDLRGALATAGGVTSEDLELIGWTKQQIKLHLEEAVSLARRQARSDSQEG